jgi:prevent-host-death family protein
MDSTSSSIKRSGHCLGAEVWCTSTSIPWSRAATERISVLEFRRDAAGVLRKVQQGRRLVLTYRGKPVARLEPIRQSPLGPDDPFYSLGRLASASGEGLDNGEIDQIIYETDR